MLARQSEGASNAGRPFASPADQAQQTRGIRIDLDIALSNTRRVAARLLVRYVKVPTSSPRTWNKPSTRHDGKPGPNCEATKPSRGNAGFATMKRLTCASMILINTACVQRLRRANEVG